MNKIVILVDFSQHSEMALQTAAHLAKKNQSQLVVVHMLELSESLVSSSESENKEQMFFMLAIANKEMKSFLSKDYLKDVNLKPVIKRHKVFKEVDELAKEEGADLIVMGSKGHSNHDGVFTGSNTQKVVRFSDVPVLVVKSPNADINNVLLITDLSESSADALNQAISFLQGTKSTITLLHINLPSTNFSSTEEINERRDKLAAKLDDPKILNDLKFISDYSVEGGVVYYTKQNKFDAIVTLTHGRKGLSHFLMGSVSEDLVNHSKLPILTFKI